MWYIAINAFLVENDYRRSAHDSCVYKKLASNQKDLELLLSLHVDDTLITAPEGIIDKFAKKLEQKFGKISYQKNSFTHFGLLTTKCPKSHNVTLCQLHYLSQIKPIEIDAKRGSGRTAESKATTEEITQYRSVVSAIAWLAQTFPPAGTVTSLYQGRLPSPTVGDLRQLNSVLAQIHDIYKPMVIRGDINLFECLILALGDASLGNASKHSQIGYIIALTNRVDTSRKQLTFDWSIITYKSQKSKRVATSTMHSELLAQSSSSEEAVNLQTFLHELKNPSLSANELLKARPEELNPIWTITDCEDLHQVLVKETAPVLSNKSMTLFTEALREHKTTGRIAQFCWCDTRDNVSNVLTKLKPDGLLDVGDKDKDVVILTLSKAQWRPQHLFKIGKHPFA
jgi:hypothetical protein